MITLIAAIGQNNELGLNNKLLWHIPEDLKHFKEYTTGKVVVMGRKTFQSIGRILPGRKCIVVSSNPPDNRVIYARDIDAALSIDYCYPEIVVIGGAQIYEQTIDRADKLMITHVDGSFVADTFFPHIDLTKWQVSSTIEGSNELYKYRFVEYVRRNAEK